VSAWETVFSPNDISGLRSSKNIRFGTKVAFSTAMMRTFRFLEIVFLIMKKFAKKHQSGPKTPKRATYSPHGTSETKIVEMWKLAQT